MSETIELNCPNCSQMLEIDIGFVGGVCRCANCATLMTVPQPGGQQTERLVRPQRPAAPGKRADAAPQKLDAEPPKRDAAPGTPGAAARQEQPAQQTLTTETGRSVQVDLHRVPVARRKKKAVKVLIVILFALLVIAAALGVAVAFLVVAGSDEDREQPVVSAGEAHRQALGFDPAVNPFTSTPATFLGVPLTARVALAVDASKTRHDWFDLMKRSIMGMAQKGADDHKLQLIYWTEDGSRHFPPEAASLKGQVEQLWAFIDAQEPRGAAEPIAAVGEAVQGRPRQIILVTEQELYSDQIAALDALLEGESAPRLDVVLIESRQQRMEELAARHSGVCITITTAQIEHWLDEAGL
jgi:hypothetical protein